jgi:hypothetical protein
MSDWVISGLTAGAVVGFATTQPVGVNTTFTLNLSSDPIKNLNINFDETIPGFLTGRRPVSGQVFPRGVYNK